MATLPTPGQIYLADQRGLTRSAQQQRYATLNFGDYQAADRAAIGALRAVNDEQLAPGQHLAFPVERATHLVLLPIEGVVGYRAGTGAAGEVDVEQVLVLTLPAGSTFTLHNPYDEAIISFVHLWLDAQPEAALGVRSFPYSFEALDDQLAELVAPTPQRRFALHLGRFQGRHEAIYQVSDPSHRLFAFVLAGAFELEGRLLHDRDGLALWQAEAVELEALSNGALVLLLELPG